MQPQTAAARLGAANPDPHALERAIHCLLAEHPAVNVRALVVHRCPQGLLLEGTVELDDTALDILQLLKTVASDVPVVNRLQVTNVASAVDQPIAAK